MSSIALNLGIEGLLAAQTALDTVGHNLANANTPGYSRQNLLLSAGPTQRFGGRQVGTGVRADAIVSVRDLLVDRRILTQLALIGRLEAKSSSLSDVEALLGEPGEGSLSSQISGFFTSISRLSANPGDNVLRQDAVRAGVDASDRFHGLQTGFEKLRKDADARLSSQVKQVNVLTNDVATLNRAIAAAELDGTQANDLRDTRDETLRSLSNLIDIAVTERKDGTIAVSTRGQIIVSSTRSFEIESSVSSQGQAVLRVKGSDQTLRPTGGSVAAFLEQVNEVLPGQLERLDALARTLIHEVNKAHSTGVPATGPFRELQSSHALTDGDDDGVYSDELLANAGLPFPIQDGALSVNITDRETGEVQTVQIPIDAEETTVGDFVDALNAIPQLTAVVEGDGFLSLRAAEGYGFDFAARSYPTTGTLGGSLVTVTDRYTGESAADLTFRSRSAGDIGATDNLLVDVFDGNGDRVATLNVGAGYVPGTELDLGNGLKASFGIGAVTNADSFELHAVADGDTSDVLAAFGLNSLFDGTGADDIHVSARIRDDPRFFAASATGADGDGGALSSILAISEASLDGLAGSSPVQYVSSIAADVGFEISSADLAGGTERALHDGLVAQRNARSGVNVDEELVSMLRFQQAYQASAQFIQVANSLNDELLNLL
jgi:flagellar hook-associated protein 1 FlgK